MLSLRHILPSEENDKLYRPIDPSDPEIIALAESIRAHGVKEPLVVTLDDFILSGHRRHAAAKLAGLHVVPCRREQIDTANEPGRFLTLLREYNRQREKSFAEKMREELVTVNPVGAYTALVEQRRASAVVELGAMKITGQKIRSAIGRSKGQFLAAVEKVLTERRGFWPLSARQIHYALLNDPPMIGQAKSGRYANTVKSYKALCDLTARARLAGHIPMAAIADETRPVSLWSSHRDPRTFIRQELKHFMEGYWRDLQQSQPNQIELMAEKNTLGGILRPVASEFCVPLTIGRGYSSLPPRHAMAERFRKTGKEKLVVLMVSDLDPDGEEIALSFARSMRDDFGINTIHAIKVAITTEQVEKYQLPPVMKAKKNHRCITTNLLPRTERMLSRWRPCRQKPCRRS